MGEKSPRRVDAPESEAAWKAGGHQQRVGLARTVWPHGSALKHGRRPMVGAFAAQRGLLGHRRLTGQARRGGQAVGLLEIVHL